MVDINAARGLHRTRPGPRLQVAAERKPAPKPGSKIMPRGCRAHTGPTVVMRHRPPGTDELGLLGSFTFHIQTVT